MDEPAVTVVRCHQCGRSGTLTMQNDRFWCAWCQDWAVVLAEHVCNALIEREAGAPRLVPRPPESVPLQPLRIPQGWSVEYNNGLYELDPLPALVPVEDRWWLFKEDMLQLGHKRLDRLLDLGWYPEGDLAAGHYGLAVYEGDCRGRELHEFCTNDRLELVGEIERVLRAVSEGKL